MVQRYCWLLAIALLGACFSPKFEDASLTCGPNELCPPGFVCGDDGRCHTMGARRDGGGDMTAPAAPMLTAVSPTSPANNSNPIVTGTAEAGTTVTIYGDSGCTTQLATGAAAQLASPGITVTVADNTTTMLAATATDDAGNTSPCSAPLSFVEDSIAPDAPLIVDTMPASPSRSVLPTVRGTAEAGATVTLYAGCTGTALGTGTANSAGEFAVVATIQPAMVTTIAAIASDAAGNLSACSGSISYEQNASAVSTPVLAATVPLSPSATDTTPMITGTAEAGTTVRLFTDPTCSGTALANGVASSNGAFTIGLTVAANTTNTYYAQAQDTSVNLYSACTASGITYEHDSLPPTAPVVLASTPSSPSNSSMPTISGTAEPGSAVMLFSDSGCTTSLAMGTAESGGTFAIAASTTVDATFYAKATDPAGNASACSSGGLAYDYDATPPSAPSSLTTVPTSPSKDSNTPIVQGMAEANSVVRVYLSNNCSGAAAASGSSGTSTFTIGVTVPSNSSNLITVDATDAAGNKSNCSSPLTYVHDTLPPAPPAITTSNPTSPANANSPMIMGTAEMGVTVQLYTDSTCTTAIGSAAVASGGTFSITIAVANNTTTTLYGKATDSVGNASACSTQSYTFTEDSEVPTAPVLTALAPSNTVTTPTLSGSAEADATVNLYASNDCSGTAAATTPATGGTFSAMVTVTANSQTPFSARAVDGSGNLSACSNSITYIHDNVTPNPPASLGSNPASPAPTTAPAITGMAESGSTVRLFTTSNCSSAVAGTATAASNGTFSIPVTVGSGSTTTFYATATDAAGNASNCSSSFVNYMEDSEPPSTPILTGTTPTSPANDTTPAVSGTAETGTTAKIFTASDCSGQVGSGTVIGGTFSITTSALTANTTTILYANATDSAGNVSGCSTGLSYTEDSAPPGLPANLATNPASPANANTPTITGTAEENAAVLAYDDASCTTQVGSTTASGAGVFGITVTVDDNTTTTFYLRARDAANNLSTCSATASITYVENSAAVETPVITGTTPSSPTNSSTSPTITGTAVTGDTVRIYANDAMCAGTPVATGTAAAGLFNIAVTGATANGTTTYYASATNGATTSGCSAGFAYIHDNTPPAAPTSLAATPAGPANNNQPTISGSAEAASSVTLFTNSACTSPLGGIGTGTATAGTFAIQVGSGVIANNTTTTIYARATDAATNASGCSTGVVYVEDSAAPNAPTLTGTSPPSPANNNNPQLLGTAESGATVLVYTSSACTTSVASGTASGPGGGFSIAVAVSNNTTSTFYARAVDAAGNQSDCTATSISYVEDSNGPGVPVLTSINPPSPSSNNQPVVSGTTDEAGATIKLYGNSACTGTVLGSGTSTLLGGLFVFDVTATVTSNATTTIFASATDPAGNVSGCSTSSFTYIEDSAAPTPPASLGTNPASPANNNSPQITGQAETGATVKVYTLSNCTGTFVSGNAASGAFSIGVSVLDNTITNYYLTATDPAGNVSTCAGPVTYREDSTANAPILSSTTPASPNGSSTTPSINGTGEANATISLYTSAAACTSNGTTAASGTISVGGSFSLAVSVGGNTSATFFGKIVDQAGNISPCSSGITYTHDNTAPTFAGPTSAVATGIDTILVSWASGSDNFTSAGNMRYDLCYRTTPTGSCTVVTSATGATSHALTGLTMGERYWIQVRAVDQAGNTSAYGGPLTDRVWGTGVATIVSASVDHTCARQANGTAWCWGGNGVGQLGNGTTTQSLAPVQVSGLEDVVSITTHQNSAVVAFSCATTSNGKVWCWGDNAYGQLGNGTTTDSTTPVEVSGISNAVSVSAGGYHACALLATGEVKCWGLGSLGRLGNGSTATQTTPVFVSGISTAITLATGAYHACVVLGDGTASCWGLGTDGQLGNGANPSTQSTPVPVTLMSGERVRSIDSGEHHTCAVLTTGTAKCWGRNTANQLGDGTTTSSNVPVFVKINTSVLGGVKEISAGTQSSCLTMFSGDVRCFGGNAFGQLGNGTTTTATTASTLVTGSGDVVQTTVGVAHACYLTAGGLIRCWGNGSNGRLGHGLTTGSLTAVNVANLVGPEAGTELFTGTYRTCAKVSSGKLHCWGYNGYGQLGDDTSSSRAYPSTFVVDSSGATIQNVVMGSGYSYHNCVVRGNGRVWCWGYNNSGQLGDGTQVNKDRAVEVSGITTAIQVVVGGSHACALLVDGSVSCWGSNSSGQLGDGTTVDKTTPVMIAGSTGVRALFSGQNTSYAINGLGSVLCWGSGSGYACGDSTTTTPKTSPVTVLGVANAVSGAAGYSSGCARLAGGGISCWGAGSYGQMGDGFLATNNTGSAVTGNSFTSVDAGFYHYCATRSSGAPQCWGYNNFGNLGNNSTTNSSTPVNVSGLGSIFEIGVGHHHSCGLHSDGTAECTGYGFYGSLGDNNLSDHNALVPAPVVYFP